MNPLLELSDHGQSYWLDNLTRGMIHGGELERRVTEEGLRGVTSNPAIFHKAITRGTEYDDQIRELVRDGLPVSDVYERIVVRDIRDACDVLRPVYEETGGGDGFVSLEVSPYLAHDTEGSVEEATRLYEAVDRPNVFIKIPGTEAGVPAIEKLLYRGVNVNVTLLFSIDAYEAVARAYLRAMERRLEEGAPLEGVASVASFFLSRIDVLVDGVLGHRIRATGDEGADPAGELMGRAGVANAKLAYRRFQELFSGDRWEKLAGAGADVQRMLWASTSTKDPLYSDVRYVEPLIGPHTVNTMPERTIRAFADGGTVAATVEEGVDEARRVMERLAEAGVDFDQVTAQLLHEGVQKFIDPYDRLTAALAERYAKVEGRPGAGFTAVLGDGEDAVRDALDSLRSRQFARRLMLRDPKAWSADPEERKRIRARLGWVEAPRRFADRAREAADFAASLGEDGIRDVLWVGMGGSCQAARAAAEMFDPGEGRPRLHVIDDTSPASVRAAEERTDPATTLVAVASKSGTTAETTALYRRFWHRAREALGEETARRFVAVTDPGTALAREAEEKGFRRCFENPADVGGRYSALTWFGLLPLALAGADPRRVVRGAQRFRAAHDGAVPPAANPGVRLGAALGMLARAGRDKVTLTFSGDVAPLAGWIQQLLAESTGKEGRGLVPVAEDSLRGADEYGSDRAFVHVRTAGSDDLDAVRRLEALEQAGHPVFQIQMEDLSDLGAEFYRWQVAAATAGAVLGVNPFDEPNVEESKRNATRILQEGDGAPPTEAAGAGSGELRLQVSGAGAAEGDSGGGAAGVEAALGGFLDAVGAGDYVALLVWFRPTRERRTALRSLRERIRERTGAATTLEFGPGYLHSTGQLHKGGADSGAFLFLTADEGPDVPIPGEEGGFARLHAAQWLGDLRALEERGRRVARAHLGSEVEQGLRDLYGFLAEPAEPSAPEPAAAR